MRIIKLLLLTLSTFAVGFVLLPTALHAQVGTQASLTGTVTDTSGAVVVSAQVTATNLATGRVSQALSSSRGAYHVLALPAGVYRVSATAHGFEAWENPRVELTVGDRINLDIVLKVGAATQTVQVRGTSSLLQADSATVETVIQMQQIRELPLDTRNPLALVALVPGMTYQGTTVGSFRDSFVQGQGLRNYTTNFQLDGISSNASSSEGGTAFPNVDAIQEFNVQTLNSGAASGRDPAQVIAVTKSGTNEFHGTLFEFNQNDIFSATNAFATKKNRIRYNQFGGTLGGPIYRNKTFFFGSFQETKIGNAVVRNEPAVTDAMKNGDFSALNTPIINPYTHTPFPGNQIPAGMINSASSYFLPLFVSANSPDGFFKFQANAPNTTYEYLGRVDHQITANQHIYGRYEYIHEPTVVVGYTPKYLSANTTNEPSFSANYTWAITNKTLLTFTGGYVRDGFSYTNPPLGKTNDSIQAGIEGIPTQGREDWIGPPDIYVTGYQGVAMSGGGWGAPGRQMGGSYEGKGSLTHIAGPHTLDVGGEYFNRTAYGQHGSAAPRGIFDFFNLYTGNGFADYLLGLTSNSNLNDPLGRFGLTRDPIMSGYATDTWKASKNLTLTLGVRYERWLQHSCFANLCTVWDPKSNMIVVGTDSKGNPNFSQFPTTASLAEETAGLWKTANQAGVPRGLYDANGHWEPRLGAIYRLTDKVVLRGGYGVYYNSFTGNRGASVINIPLWTEYGLSFGKNTLQDWKTVWAAGPHGASNFSVYSPLVNTEPSKTREWNATLQLGLPGSSALTLSYVGTHVTSLGTWKEYNAAPVGFHQNIQADRPNPRFSNITLTANEGRNWYNGLQSRIERRYHNGLAFTAAYSWSKTMTVNTGDCETCALLQYSPDWYNRNVSTMGYPQVESATVVWQLPYGHGRTYGGSSGFLENAILGGWEVAALQTAHSGIPLTIGQSNGNLGNGYSSRAKIVGNPEISEQNKDHWFNTSAFAPAPLYTFGNSGVGAVNGPGGFQLNSSVAKDFPWKEGKYFQFRWETFNLTNHVNYNNPNTNVVDRNFGKITGSGAARYMQFGAKIVF